MTLANSIAESNIESQVLRWCKDNDFLCIKFTPQGDVGWPDRIIIAPTGQHIWVELKAPGKKPRKMQDYRIEQLRRHGAVAVWFDDAEECIQFLECIRP